MFIAVPDSHVVDIEQKSLTKHFTLSGNLVYSINICIQGKNHAETFCGTKGQKMDLAGARKAGENCLLSFVQLG